MLTSWNFILIFNTYFCHIKCFFQLTIITLLPSDTIVSLQEYYGIVCILCPRTWYEHGSMPIKAHLGTVLLMFCSFLHYLMSIRIIKNNYSCSWDSGYWSSCSNTSLVINKSSYSWDLETFNLIITKSSAVLRLINTSLIKHKLVLAAAATDFTHYHA